MVNKDTLKGSVDEIIKDWNHLEISGYAEETEEDIELWLRTKCLSLIEQTRKEERDRIQRVLNDYKKELYKPSGQKFLLGDEYNSYVIFTKKNWLDIINNIK